MAEPGAGEGVTPQQPEQEQVRPSLSRRFTDFSDWWWGKKAAALEHTKGTYQLRTTPEALHSLATQKQEEFEKGSHSQEQREREISAADAVKELAEAVAALRSMPEARAEGKSVAVRPVLETALSLVPILVAEDAKHMPERKAQFRGHLKALEVLELGWAAAETYIVKPLGTQERSTARFCDTGIAITYSRLVDLAPNVHGTPEQAKSK